jgi:hypothetical protein
MIPTPDVTLALIYFAILGLGIIIGIIIEHKLMESHELKYLQLVMKLPTTHANLIKVLHNKRDELIIAEAQQRIENRK